MAYVKNPLTQQEQELEKTVTTPGEVQPAAVPTAPEGGLISGASTAPAPKSSTTQPTQNFATIQSYLDANKAQGQKLAQNLVAPIASEIGTAKQNVTTAGTEIGKQIQAGVTNPDEALITKVVAQPNLAEQPTDVQAAYQAQQNLKYTGPTQPTLTPEYQKALESLSKPTSDINLSQTEAGRKILLENMQKNKAPGITGLNQALISMNPEATSTLIGAKPAYNQLQSFLGTTGQDLGKQVEAAQAKQPTLFPAALQKIGTNAQNSTFSKVADRLTQQAFQMQYITEPAISAAIYAGGFLTPEQAGIMGISPKQWTNIRAINNTMKQQFGFQFPYQNYYKAGAPPASGVNTMNVSTFGEVQYMMDLAKLMNADIKPLLDTLPPTALTQLEDLQAIKGQVSPEQWTAIMGQQVGQINKPQYDYNKALADTIAVAKQYGYDLFINSNGDVQVRSITTKINPDVTTILYPINM